MSRIFDPENKFWSAISKVADVICMSVLWTITSLPLVTMGGCQHRILFLYHAAGAGYRGRHPVGLF